MLASKSVGVSLPKNQSFVPRSTDRASNALSASLCRSLASMTGVYLSSSAAAAVRRVCERERRTRGLMEAGVMYRGTATEVKFEGVR